MLGTMRNAGPMAAPFVAGSAANIKVTATTLSASHDFSRKRSLLPGTLRRFCYPQTLCLTLRADTLTTLSGPFSPVIRS